MTEIDPDTDIVEDDDFTSPPDPKTERETDPADEEK
jgi:hypothetical protein